MYFAGELILISLHVAVMAAPIDRQFFSSPSVAELMTFLDEEDEY